MLRESPMAHHKRWLAALVAPTAVVGLAIGGVMVVLGRRFLEEFTRPGVTVEQGTPQWGGWTFPEAVAETPHELQRAVTFLGGQLLFHSRYRHPLVARPDQAIGDHGVKQTLRATGTMPPAILLIHAEDDPMVALHHAHRLVAAARAAGRSIKEYYTSCAIHCGSYGHDPHRYMALILEFVAL